MPDWNVAGIRDSCVLFKIGFGAATGLVRRTVEHLINDPVLGMVPTGSNKSVAAFLVVDCRSVF